MGTHLWVRAEQRENEDRVGLTPAGAKALLAAGMRVTVEESHCRALPIEGYREAGCEIAPENTWPDAPTEAIIFGLKELPEDGTPLPPLFNKPNTGILPAAPRPRFPLRLPPK